jgi:hypothetical protein
LKKRVILTATVLLILILGVAAYNLWPNVTIPISVTEPIEILNYSPTSIELFPGEFENISITVQNHADLNYSVILSYQLNDTAYQHSFVTFSNEIYEVPNGVTGLDAWLLVEPNAPAINATLIIDVQRVKPDEPIIPSQADLLEEHFNDLARWNKDSASTLVEINPSGQLHTIGGFAYHYLSFPAQYTVEFKLKVDNFDEHPAGFQVYSSRSQRTFHIYSNKIAVGNGIVGFEEFSVLTDNNWHAWKLVIDEDTQEASVYKDDAHLATLTRSTVMSGLTQRIYTGTERDCVTEAHWDYVFISTGLNP